MPSSTYDTIVKAAAAFLQETGSTGPDSSKSNKQIVAAIRSKIQNGEISVDAADGTMLSYLSNAANTDVESNIVSGGPRGGYWYSQSKPQITEAKPADEEKIKPEKGAEITILEKDLYPLMELWLQQKGYKSKDMSNVKSGGRWGNPDIIGAERVELFGAVEIDLASCEVKLAEQNWEQVIFEAISHKRFANRSWFCYRLPQEQVIPKGMAYYAERYRVGVVQIVLTDEELINLKSGKAKPLDLIDNVIEKIPALYDYVPLREQRDLVDRTGISLTVSF
ncbi:hypothetical protein ANOBCDAF_04653 [Pleomorphomonas sp. T1.2MG-36]|uniref:hypothetical protein n=1 Tax=Pleomorphomonas sp. T1.2MG-36 TaxID=3041167 RepID=UPI002477A0BD|nr:hypothetical protein [Pleomorphomonas sp. T1.2MG-36]CAI9404613.1 hypothetical protein ANOBCDAF_04653 [Pleomorphomonas sp. T1.2MG-36]